MTTFPPAPERLGFPHEPDRQDWTPSTRDVEIVTLASRGIGGNFLPDADGNVLAALPDIITAGAGIYVVDCPLGYDGRLILNDIYEIPIALGDVIPIRYTRLRLANNYADGARGIGYAQNPVVLAIGPRGHEYRRQGTRHHWWGSDYTDFQGRTIAAGSNYQSPGALLWVRGYDQIAGVTEISPVGILHALSPIYEWDTPSRYALELDLAPTTTSALVSPTSTANVPILSWTHGRDYYSPLLHNAPLGFTPGTLYAGYASTGSGIFHTELPVSMAGIPRRLHWRVNNAAAVSADFTVSMYGAVRVS